MRTLPQFKGEVAVTEGIGSSKVPRFPSVVKTVFPSLLSIHGQNDCCSGNHDPIPKIFKKSFDHACPSGRREAVPADVFLAQGFVARAGPRRDLQFATCFSWCVFLELRTSPPFLELGFQPGFPNHPLFRARSKYHTSISTCISSIVTGRVTTYVRKVALDAAQLICCLKKSTLVSPKTFRHDVTSCKRGSFITSF